MTKLTFHDEFQLWPDSAKKHALEILTYERIRQDAELAEIEKRSPVTMMRIRRFVAEARNGLNSRKT